MKRADRVISVFLIALGLFVIWMAGSLPPAPMKGTPGPGYLPRLLSGLMVIGAAILFVSTFIRRGDPKILFEPHSAPRLLYFTLLAVLVPAGLAYGGFILTCFLSSFIFFWIMKVKIPAAIIISVLLTGGIYLAFHYGLQVQFPPGIF
ncbi:MAG: tripartite tricarboxylate transporter TctB family protein [Deltaproteobacteria bacterium]|nr:tripartite tricarboxylate transporter TctB family protein [Deltaproteobacteria bacterium]